MSSQHTPVHLALEIDGEGRHPQAWRRADHAPAAALGARRWTRVSRGAENAGFTLATVHDTPVTEPDGPAGRLDGVLRSAFGAGLTSRLGWAPQVHPRAVEPFHLAAQLASLDHASRGRGAWLVGDADLPGLAPALGREVPTEPAGRRREVLQVIDAVRRLWDSWDDDAVIKDVATGRYIDRDRVRYSDIESDTFSIRGALITPRPPQGQPVVLAPDGLLADSDLPGRIDVVLVADVDPDAAVARATELRSLGVLAFIDLQVTLDLPGGPTASGRLRDLGPVADTAAGAAGYAGSPAGLIALVSSLRGRVDGVRLLPSVLDEDLPVLAGHVLPALSLARVARPPRPAAQLRTTLGLPRPINRLDLEVSA